MIIESVILESLRIECCALRYEHASNADVSGPDKACSTFLPVSSETYETSVQPALFVGRVPKYLTRAFYREG